MAVMREMFCEKCNCSAALTPDPSPTGRGENDNDAEAAVGQAGRLSDRLPILVQSALKPQGE